jgi:D-inositol-3-phosphate glycosyltransferase
MLVDGVSGLLVPPGSPELMADRVRRLLDDDRLRERLGENARRRVRELYAEDHVLQRYSTLYRSLVAG